MTDFAEKIVAFSKRKGAFIRAKRLAVKKAEDRSFKSLPMLYVAKMLQTEEKLC